nr:MAG: DNA pilot protein [Microvirus sp.]
MWQAIGAIGSSLLGGFFGSSGAKKQNQAQIQSAREQMDFQERMSNTAHQREVKDLQKAGLNPILSAKLGGASSPGGAMPNIQNELAPMQNAAQSMSDKMYNFKIQDAQVQNMRLQNDMIQQQIEQLKISNARQGLLTPVYETGGKIVDKLTGLFNGSDIVSDVLDAGNSDGLNDSPSSARSFDALRFVLPIGTKDSEARKWAQGEKSFLQSLRDANKSKLTEETLRRYGIRRLKELEAQAKNRDL